MGKFPWETFSYINRPVFFCAVRESRHWHVAILACGALQVHTCGVPVDLL